MLKKLLGDPEAWGMIALTSPAPGIRQTASGESGASGQIWQTPSAESVAARGEEAGEQILGVLREWMHTNGAKETSC